MTIDSSRTRATKIAAVALCAVIAAALLLSSAVLVTHAHHEHDHRGHDDGCAACEHISLAAGLLCAFGAAVAVISAAPPSLKRAPLREGPYTTRAPLQSLVSLKVRLDL
ncbi:MAG: hypothetical protein LBH17_07875 [Oscillospiraceae bacterium]|jgi:hypothetical protein|nr:hypothetical protein [Oscillospiraceae bacterium]